MNKLILLVLILIASPVIAGGSSFELKVINLDKISEDEYHFSFEPLTTPYGENLNDFSDGLNKMTVIIKFGCNQSFYTCTFNERNHSKEQHILAMKKLIDLAIPDTKLEFGVISSGFSKIENKKGYYRSNGLFLSNNDVYSYVKSHY